ncbi:MAG: tRNA preQ1(34) S-adenosylmethionine ribosyltransferase-isomerase QueA [Acidimicrobiales bacterium]|nr:tRNA preQ1(34) S-adenosylmethionine ribosyltransferase-isomerase QueA [Acidimicrobiales bacterium]
MGQASSHYDYHLPAEAIAQEPAHPRDSARLLVDTSPHVEPIHRHVRELPSLIRPGDVLVVNDTRVAAARLALLKPSGGAVEVLVLEPVDLDAQGEAGAGWWSALVRPSRRVAVGTVLNTADGLPALEVGGEYGSGQRVVRAVDAAMAEVMQRCGEVPLPPYITAPLADTERYQTVYAAEPTSVAAPTAGLHFTPALLEACAAAGAQVHRVQLSVGVGTFRPISAARVEQHEMHAERYRVAEHTLAACRAAERVIAVGTTTVRALESAAVGDLEGSTSLYIRPGYNFELVDVLLTNFHLPRSSLLVMLEAFCGPRWIDLYAVALAAGYRFLSLGDAMITQRSDRSASGDTLL